MLGKTDHMVHPWSRVFAFLLKCSADVSGEVARSVQTVAKEKKSLVKETHEGCKRNTTSPNLLSSQQAQLRISQFCLSRRHFIWKYRTDVYHSLLIDLSDFLSNLCTLTKTYFVVFVTEIYTGIFPCGDLASHCQHEVPARAFYCFLLCQLLPWLRIFWFRFVEGGGKKNLYPPQPARWKMTGI